MEGPMKLKLKCAVAIALLSLVFAPTTLAQDNCTRPRLISVTGTAEIEVAPDEAVLRLGIDTRDKDLARAKSQHDTRAKKVLALAHDAGVEAKYIQTSELTMGPEYTLYPNRDLVGYQVSQTIAITLKDPSKYEALMTDLLGAGVNRVDSIDFRVAEPRKYEDEARAKAIRAAREKAVAMAGELGQTIGKPWSISEESEDSENGRYRTNVHAGGGGGGGGTPTSEESTVALGQVTIRASVSVSFLLE
jgi:uncharacterized protein